MGEKFILTDVRRFYTFLLWLACKHPSSWDVYLYLISFAIYFVICFLILFTAWDTEIKFSPNLITTQILLHSQNKIKEHHSLRTGIQASLLSHPSLNSSESRVSPCQEHHPEEKEACFWGLEKSFTLWARIAQSAMSPAVSPGLDGCWTVSSDCHLQPYFTSSNCPGHWTTTQEPLLGLGLSIDVGKTQKVATAIAYQVIRSQHLLLHIRHGTQRLQVREAVLHHKRHGRGTVAGDETRGQG